MLLGKIGREIIHKMASRPELVQMCIELDIDWRGLSIQELTEEIRKEADRRFNKRYPISTKNLSKTLRKFLVKEYDYVMKDKEGKNVAI